MIKRKVDGMKESRKEEGNKGRKNKGERERQVPMSIQSTPRRSSFPSIV
jgi:hypothetical protein